MPTALRIIVPVSFSANLLMAGCADTDGRISRMIASPVCGGVKPVTACRDESLRPSRGVFLGEVCGIPSMFMVLAFPSTTGAAP